MRRIAILGTAGVVAATAATLTLTTLGTPTAQARELTPFSSCGQLRDWYVKAALPQVTAWGWGGYGWGYDLRFGVATDGVALAEARASAPAAADTAVGNSATGTNVQEAGVDEPDFAKTDGSLTVHLVNGRTLVVTDVSGDQAESLARFALPKDMFANELLLVGDTVVIDGATTRRPDVRYPPGPAIDGLRPLPTWSEPEARMLTVSISDPTDPSIVTDRRIDGSVLSMRQYGEVVRVVTTSGLPQLDFVQPEGSTTEKQALRHNRQIVRASTIEDWLPEIRTSSQDGGTPLVACSDVSHPRKQSGFGTISILTFPANDLDARRTIAVTAGGNLVYSSADRLYLATTTWGWFGGPLPAVGLVEAPAPRPLPRMVPGERADSSTAEEAPSGGGSTPKLDPSTSVAGGPDDVSGSGRQGESAAPAPATSVTAADSADDVTRTGPDESEASDVATTPRQRDITTEIHAFALDGLSTTYVASGEVQGTVKDRWSFSEYDHDLRVATGLGQQWQPTDNGITVLREEGDRLVRIGGVRGLGPNEQIQSVRWLGNLGIVVTFRQTDPLYTVDLSDPTNPRVMGELKVRGFSAYLHPLGDGLLLGIGQDARRNGRTVGGQAAVFDISDVTDPQRLDTYFFGRGTHPAASWEPRAFTYLPDQRLALTPVSDLRGQSRLYVLSVGDDGSLTRERVVTLEQGWAEGTRVLPVDGGRVAVVDHQTVTVLQP